MTASRGGALPPIRPGVVDGVLRDLGTEVVDARVARRRRDGVGAARAGLVADLLTDDISILDDAAVGLELRVGRGTMTTSMPHRVLFDERTFSTYLVYWGARRSRSRCRSCCRSKAYRASTIR